MPLAVGLQLQHVAVRGNGVETVKVVPLEDAATEDEFTSLLGEANPVASAPDEVIDDEISRLLRLTEG